MRRKKRDARMARRLFRLCLVDGHLDDARTRLVVQRVAAAGRRDLGVLAQLSRQVRLHRARQTAHVESATPLPAELQAHMRQDITRLFGSGIETTFAQDAALIGGVRVRVGSTVYDGSVRGRLAAIGARL